MIVPSLMNFSSNYEYCVPSSSSPGHRALKAKPIFVVYYIESVHKVLNFIQDAYVSLSESSSEEAL